MKEWLKNLTVLSLLLVVIAAGGVYKADAAGFWHGHRSGADVSLISTLDLSAQEQAALKSALVTYGSAVKTAWQQLRTAKEQAKTGTGTTSQDGTALAAAKAQLEAARAQLDSALFAALTPEHLQQLQAQLTAKFQSRLDAKTGRVLAEYARQLEKQ